MQRQGEAELFHNCAFEGCAIPESGPQGLWNAKFHAAVLTPGFPPIDGGCRSLFHRFHDAWTGTSRNADDVPAVGKEKPEGEVVGIQGARSV